MGIYNNSSSVHPHVSQGWIAAAVAAPFSLPRYSHVFMYVRRSHFYRRAARVSIVNKDARIVKKLEKNTPQLTDVYLIRYTCAPVLYAIERLPRNKKTSLTPRQTNACAYLVSSSVFKKYIAPRQTCALSIISTVRTALLLYTKKP